MCALFFTFHSAMFVRLISRYLPHTWHLPTRLGTSVTWRRNARLGNSDHEKYNLWMIEWLYDWWRRRKRRWWWRRSLLSLSFSLYHYDYYYSHYYYDCLYLYRFLYSKDIRHAFGYYVKMLPGSSCASKRFGFSQSTQYVREVSEHQTASFIWEETSHLSWRQVSFLEASRFAQEQEPFVSNPQRPK